MRAMQHIPVDRKAGAAAFEAAVRALKDGEVVGVFPEATISTSFTVKDLKAGAARMAVAVRRARSSRPPSGAGTGSPPRATRSTCAAAWPVTVILGEPIVAEPGEKAQSLLRRTRAAMEALLDEAQRSYPAAAGGSRRPLVAARAPRRHRTDARGGGGRRRDPRRRQGAEVGRSRPRSPG